MVERKKKGEIEARKERDEKKYHAQMRRMGNPGVAASRRKPGSRPQEIERRAIITGMVYVLRAGCPWQLMPHDVPGRRTVSLSFCEWEQAGSGEPVHAVLRRHVCLSAANPSQVRLSWTVNRSKPVPSVAMRVGTMGKKIPGRKRHLLVETQGLLLSVKVPCLQLIWAATAYQGTFEDGVREYLVGVRMEIVNHPWTDTGTWAPIGTKVEGDKIIPKGFHILPRRWVIERTNAWIMRNRRLSRDFEGTHTAFIYPGHEQTDGGPPGSQLSLMNVFLYRL